MGKDSSIGWCDDTVNPAMGCDGCELWIRGAGSCYAAHLHATRGKSNKGFAPTFEQVTLFAGRTAKAARFADLRGTPRPEKPWLDGAPRMIFVSDMGDALSRAVPFDYLKREIVDVITSEDGRRHVWLWLTKRTNRMAEFAASLREQGIEWPENLWPGTTITSQATIARARSLLRVGDERTTRFLSVEPQLDEIDFGELLARYQWVIQGGESGKDARPFDIAWARKLRDECQGAGVAFFLKQLGAAPTENGRPLKLKDSHAGDWAEWPEDLRVREVPAALRGERRPSPAPDRRRHLPLVPTGPSTPVTATPTPAPAAVGPRTTAPVTSAPPHIASDDLPFVNFGAFEVPDEEHRWLVRDAWGLGAVGIVGGDPKLGKTILTDELAVAVASGAPFLGRHEVVRQGRVLIASMEGQRWLTTDRIHRICQFRGIDPASLPIDVLDQAVLRLDDERDLQRLGAAVRRTGAVLLVLDPLVRLHLGDENVAGNIARVLGGLQGIQRQTGVAIAVVHHNKKNVAKSARPGSGLRGSSDLHAWGDSNWYLRAGEAGDVSLTIEHRAAPSPSPLRMKLHGADDLLGFEIVEGEVAATQGAPTGPSLRDRVLDALRAAEGDGIGFGALREGMGANAGKVSEALKMLDGEGLAEKRGRVWTLRSVPALAPESPPERNGPGRLRSVPSAGAGEEPKDGARSQSFTAANDVATTEGC
jgi:protein gp37